MTARLWLALILALVPGLYAWVRGRRVVAHLDEPVFPERYHRYRTVTGQVLVVCWVLMVFASPRTAIWLVILSLLATLAGTFPAHKRIHRERWGLFAFLLHNVRVLLVALGAWLMALCAPGLYTLLGGGWLAASILVPIGLVWTTFTATVVVRGLAARPIEQPELLHRLESVLAGSVGPRPGLFRGGPEGGRWINGMAIPGRRPAVLLTDDLIAELSPEETRAIFAHEVAHVETFSTVTWRLRRFMPALLIAIYPSVKWLFEWLDLGSFSTLLWLLMSLLALALVSVGTRRRETEADLRALELTGDPHALMSGLERLYTLARLPRRTSSQQEQRHSHPSLQNRLRAIREAAGLPLSASPGGHARAGESLAPPPDVVVLVSEGQDRVVILEGDRIEWLDGVPGSFLESDVGDPSALREVAGLKRTVRYGELEELRLRARGSKPTELICKDRWGHEDRLPLRGEDVAAAEAALLRAEPLVRGVSVEHQSLHGRADLLRIAVLLIALAALLWPRAWGLVLLGFVAAAWPSTFSVAAVAGATLVDTATRILLGAMGSGPALALLTMAALAAVLLLAAWRRHRTELAALRPGGQLPAWIAAAAALGLGALTLSSALYSSPAMGLHLWIRGVPAALGLTAGLAAGLCFLGRRGARTAGWALLSLTVSAPLLGSSWFRGASGDPLADLPPTFPMEEATWQPVRSLSIREQGYQLRISPRGGRVAVAAFETSAANGQRDAWIVVEDADSVATIPAVSPVWIDEDVLAYLDRAEEHLHRRDFGSDLTDTWTLPEPEVADQILMAALDGWRILPSFTHPGRLIELRGVWSDPSVRRVQWIGSPDQMDLAEDFVETVGLGTDAVMSYAGVYRRSSLWLPMAMTSGTAMGTRLWLGADEHIADVGTTALWLQCGPMRRSETVVCATRGRPPLEVWRLDRAVGRLRAVGRIPHDIAYTEFLTDGLRLVRWDGPDLLVDPVRAVAIPFPELGRTDDAPGEEWIVSADYRDGVLALLLGSGETQRVLIYGLATG